MTIQTGYAPSSGVWTGAETSFGTGIYVDDAAHLVVQFTPTGGTQETLTKDVHYSVTLSAGVATVVPVSFPASAGTLAFSRRTPDEQQVAFVEGGSVKNETNGHLHDLAVLRDQELRHRASDNADRITDVEGQLLDQAVIDAAKNATLGYRNEAEDFRDGAAAIVADATAITGTVPRVSRLTLKAADPSVTPLAYLVDGVKSDFFEGVTEDISAHMEVEEQTSATVNTATDTITRPFHQLDLGSAIYTKTGRADFPSFTLRWVIPVTESTFKVATTFANAIAGIASDLTVSDNFSYFRHADPHEGIYIIPTGMRCDASQGCFKRRKPDAGKFHSEWWGVNEGFAANEGIMNTVLHAVKDGASLFIDPAETYYPITGYMNIRWREIRKIEGVGASSWFHGDGLPGSVFRVFRGSTEICWIKGGNFSGQVVGGLAVNDANLSESCFVHALALDQGMQFDGAIGDQNQQIHVHHCIAYDVDSGVTIAANMVQDTVSGQNSLSPIYYSKWSRAWASENIMFGIRRQGLEVFLTEFMTGTSNFIEMGVKGVGFSTSRAVRLCGCLNWAIAHNIFIGNDEGTSGNRGISIETASMSLYDDPAAVRHGGKGIATGNYLQNFQEDFAFVGGKGPIAIRDNIGVGDVAKRTAVKPATITIASPCVVTIANHLLNDGDPITFATNGALPTGVTAGVVYYVRRINDHTVNITENKNGSTLISTSGAQSGAHTATIPRASEVLTWFIRQISASFSEGLSDNRVIVEIANPAVAYWCRTPGVCTITIASPGVVTLNAHGFQNDDPIVISSTGTLPTGVTANEIYYARNVTSNTLEVAATRGGASIATSGAQSGSHTITGPTRTLMRTYENDPITLYTNGTLPTGTQNGEQFFAKNVDAANGKFELSLRPGESSIATSGSQSGQHRVVNNRWDDAKNQIDDLTVVGNVAYCKAIFHENNGRVNSHELLLNHHVGNANATSKFSNIVGINDIGSLERVVFTLIELNRSITNKLSAGGSVSISNTKAGENYYVRRNLMSGGSSNTHVSEAGTAAGNVHVEDAISNETLPADLWRTLYNPPPEHGAFDLGAYTP